MKITRNQLEAAYKVAKRVYAGDIDNYFGADELEKDHGMNIVTAGNFIRSFDRMMKGSAFYRTISVEAADYFLQQINQDFGLKHLAGAITSIQQHRDYYEQKKSVKLPSLRAVLERHSALLSSPVDFDKYQKDFLLDVEKSLLDSAEARRKRLRNAATQPKRKASVGIIFIRNPDVVAEVLHRSNGSCERCKQSAPFLRRKDKSPYLEVHHKILLASGGPDTVENALALCPNCHRELHFGFDK